MHTTGPIDKIERDNWNADASRRAKRWLIWTLLLLVGAYFIPLRWSVLLAVLYARLADPDLSFSFGDLEFAFPFLFQTAKRNTIYATSVVLKDKSSVDTRARLHILENGEAALSLYDEGGDETALFTSGEPKGAELEELHNGLSELTESMEGNSEVLDGLSHDSRVLLEAVRRIRPGAIKSMEEIRSYDDAAEERYSAHTRGERHWSDYDPSVKRLENEILKIRATPMEIQSKIAQLQHR